MTLWNEVKAAGLINGVVQDKLWLPGLVKLKKLIDDGFFGRILSVRGEFGYWVFEGEDGKLQRPSWNYRKEDGGGLIIHMLCHWRYVIDHIFGNIKSITNLGVTHIPKRWDENNNPYDSTADDAAYTTMELENGNYYIYQVQTISLVRLKCPNLDIIFEDPEASTFGSYASVRLFGKNGEFKCTLI